MKKLFFISIILPLVLKPCELFSQHFTQKNEIKIFKDSVNLENGWYGGVNFAQFSEADINNDGIKDLVWVDLADMNVNGLLKNQNLEFNKTPVLPYFFEGFPTIEHWLVLEDYNCDDVPDIFCANGNGIKTYLGYFNENNFLQFELDQNYLFSESNDTILVLFDDLPAFIDIDDDGDIDILNFAYEELTLNLYKNTAIENNLSCGNLQFEIEPCWGDFSKNIDFETSSLILGYDCEGGLINDESDEKTPRHVSGTSLTFSDIDNDNDNDLFLSEIGWKNVTLVKNELEDGQNIMIEQDTLFPFYDTPVHITGYPTAFVNDINADGLNDILVSNLRSNSVGSNNCWFYSNIGDENNPEFELKETNFLTKSMIDHNMFSHPHLIDLDNDGLQDLLVGGYGAIEVDTLLKSLAFYKNIGDKNTPVFELIDDNFLNLKQISNFPDSGFRPTTGDLDNDGDLDLVLGTYLGFIHIFTNNSTPDSIIFDLTYERYNGIDVGKFATPILVDINKDGNLDMVVGEENGNLNYFENMNSEDSLTFEWKSEFWGEVDVRVDGEFTGSSVPFLIKTNAENGDFSAQLGSEIGFDDENSPFLLLVGAKNGQIFAFDGIEENIESGAFNLISSKWENIDVGKNCSPFLTNHLHQANTLDLFLGNVRGGINHFQYDLTTTSTQNYEKNPYKNFTIKNHHIYFDHPLNHQITVKIFDVNGRVTWESQPTNNTFIQIPQTIQGFFICQFNNPNYLSQKIYLP